MVSRRSLERLVAEGNNPVGENQSAQHKISQSTTGHEEPRGKQGGPPSKTKYYLATDSEPVP